MMLPDANSQKQNVLAQLMQQHQDSALRFAGHAGGLGLNSPFRAVAPPIQPRFGLYGVNVPQKPDSFPSAVFGPTVARVRSAGV